MRLTAPNGVVIDVAIPAGARPGATFEVAMPPAASHPADVPPPPQSGVHVGAVVPPPNPDRAREYSDEARAALRAIDDAAALRAQAPAVAQGQTRAIDVEGARDEPDVEPATWAEWFGFSANPDPEPATGAERVCDGRLMSRPSHVETL